MPVGQLGQAAGRGEPLGEQHVHEREQQVRVGARPDRVVLVGDLGRAAAARVDDDELAAARPQRLAAGRACRARSSASRWTRAGWRRASAGAACGRRRGSGPTSGAPNMSPQEISFGRWSTVLAEKTLRVPSALTQHAAVEQRGEAVRGRVADVDGDGVAAVRGRHRARAASPMTANASSQLAGAQLAVRAADQRRRAAGRGPRAGPSAPRPSGTGSRARTRRRRRRAPSRRASSRTRHREAARRLAERARPERRALLHAAEPTPSERAPPRGPSRPPRSRPRRGG